MKRIYVVGLGPGSAGGITLQARQALEESELIVGYTGYVEQVRQWLGQKEYLDTPMRQEVARCQAALQAAQRGQTVAMVCSGDAGVYGMAGLLLELAQSCEPVEIQIVPGVTAALSGAALLGSPLTNDFAVVSLSDLLTPWPVIEKRLAGAAAADFVLCLYNPASKRRVDHLRRACEILLRYRSPETAAGVVRQIGRPGESAQITTLGQLREQTVDMFTTVFVGNSLTQVIAGRMVTPRGYRLPQEDKSHG